MLYHNLELISVTTTLVLGIILIVYYQKKCPICHTTIGKHHKYCFNCGFENIPEAKVKIRRTLELVLSALPGFAIVVLGIPVLALYVSNKPIGQNLDILIRMVLFSAGIAIPGVIVLFYIMMKRCPNCSEVFPQKNAYCFNCGYKLPTG